MDKDDKKDGNIFDRIFRENADPIFIPMVKYQLDMRIKRYKALTVKLPKTVEREMDFLYEVELEDGTVELLHLEFQTKGDANMIYRVGFYHGMAWFEYRKPIRHVVIYLGKGKTRMRTQLTDGEIFKGFDLININEMDTEMLLSSQVPEVILLAFLSDYPTKRREEILRLVIEQLKKYSTSKSELSRYLQQLTILARLRNFDNKAIQIVKDMPLLQDFDVTQDILYQEGREEGREEGIEIGQQGMVIHALEKGKTYEEIIDFTGLTWEEIERIDKERKKSE